jgi:hypothetical protein
MEFNNEHIYFPQYWPLERTCKLSVESLSESELPDSCKY